MSDCILITGGAGYIGSHVVKYFGEMGLKTVCIDNLSTGCKESVKYGDFIEGDIGNTQFLNDLFSNYSFSSVIHFAGSIVVPESIENPLKYYRNNTINSLNLIDKCLEHKVRNFIFSSTAAVYGNVDDEVVNEQATTSPINPYGSSKLMVEQILQDTAFAHPDFNFIALRYFNVSGASFDGEIGQAFPGATHLIKVNCEAASGKREKVKIFGTDFPTKDGTGVRDYIHVVDLAKAHFEALRYLKSNQISDIFNCGYGKGFSVRQVVDTVKAVSGVDYPVEEVERRKGDPAKVVADVSKIHSKTSWKPEHEDLKDIISTAYNWENSEAFKSWSK